MDARASLIRTDPRHELFERHGIHLSADAVFIGTDKGAVAFTGYTGDDVELHMVGDGRWVTPVLLRSVWAYVWDALSCSRCTALIRDDRHGSLRIAFKLGFQVEGRKRQADCGLDVWLLGMLREECAYGKVEPKHADADS